MWRLILLCSIALALPSSAAAATTFIVDGRGWGHGVGMSQYGARGFAESGWRHQRILKHFYRGTQLTLIPARPVRVLLLEGKGAVRIGSSKPFKVVDALGKVRRHKPGTLNVAAGKIAAARLPLRYEAGAAPLVLDGNAYRGKLLVHRVGGRLTIVNKLPLDRYLRGVVPWEMPEEWHPEALRAQAVVARSYALATLKPGKLYDLYADTRSQVYGGVRAEEVSTNRAIGSTAGRVLTWNGRVATTFYHSTSGGKTVSVAEAWPRARAVPYLVSVADPHDNLSKHHRWGPFRMSPGEVGAKLGVSGLRDVLLTRGESGRVTGIRLKLASGTRPMLPQDFRRALDLRSTWFDLRVLNLELERGRALASAGLPVVLTGFVRGLRKLRLERQVNGGTWTTVKRVQPRPDGRFTVTVEPHRTTSYRLATPAGSGAAVTVTSR
ncbi:MAG: SpoIID/LytB domain-containing protein [Actinomycetota bacterium]|nr:SpoIID/LytB domain-containing protein [Actinomycetota bacterium]